ncbi:MAG: hypothetical protein HC833_07915 [Leptolyngbyaceae cyanobacterium RM1_406_9]|nr:hypothetical protein [Leptolyngbyaceae cyanobacterium RM1_406_9]
MFHDKVKEALEGWIGAISTVLIESGLDETLARQRSEDALIAIQGTLVISRALDDPNIFQRIMQQLPQELCQTV